jgi:purine-binding chemotaxis protein CheW
MSSRTSAIAADTSGLAPLPAAGADDRATTAGTTELINFAVGNEQYGVDIMAVREIKGWLEVTCLPNQPDYVRGVLNLRGAMVPIVDVRCRFGQGMTDATPLHVVIIVQVEGRQVGLLADRVLDIVSFAPSQIERVPQVSGSAGSHFLSGLATVNGSLIALIDLHSLLSLEPEQQAAPAHGNSDLHAAAS